MPRKKSLLVLPVLFLILGLLSAFYFYASLSYEGLSEHELKYSFFLSAMLTTCFLFGAFVGFHRYYRIKK